MHWGPVVAKNKNLTVIDCVHCGWAHLYPLPDEEEVKAFYEADGQYTDDSWFDKELEEHQKGLWDAAYREQADILSDEKNVLIDWGCGAGFFVDWYRLDKKSGYCIGVEPSSRARSYSCILGSPIAPFIFPPSIEEFIPIRPIYTGRVSLVLEHLPNPLGFLEMIKSTIESKLLVIVPNELNPLQKKVGGNWWVQEHHINYFTPQGLRRLLWKAGFKVTYETATAPMEIFLLLGLDYRENDELGRKCHEARLRFEQRFSKSAFALYHLLYKKFGIGRELVFVAEKIK